MAATDTKAADQSPAKAATALVPKRIVNAQTVCNEKNEKGKLCNGHLKQLRTAGEPAEIHLRGDDVLYKCQTCGTLYMGPPLGHVHDPNKQRRFVEAELAALLQAAGGTLPVIKKDERGVYVMVETAPADGHAAKPAPTKPAPAAAPAKPTPAAPKAATPAAQPAAAPKAPAPKPPSEHKAGAQPNRQLFKRGTYAGVTDTGPVPGETFAQKVARLQALSAAAKKRAEEGGDEAHTAPATEAPAPPPAAESTPPAAKPAVEHKAGAQPNRQLFKRGTYAGFTDTGPVPGETFEQKIARLQALSAAAKRRADEGGDASHTAPAAEVASAIPAETVESSTTTAEPVASTPAPETSGTHTPTGNADRTLMKRGTYCGVVDTGPVSGETHEQKIARLTALAAAAKQRAEGG